MAIRTRKDRKNPYLVYWRNPFTQKIESKSFARKEEAEKYNALTQYRLKYERDYFIPEVEQTEEIQVPDTLESVFYLYLRERNFEKGNLERTLQATKQIMDKYGATAIEDIDMAVMMGMQNLCAEAGNKGSTIRRKMTIIKSVLNWARKHNLLDQLPIYPDMPKCETARYIPPTPEEISRIYNIAPAHLKRVIILGFMLGVRVGPCELFSLKWEDVSFEKAFVRVKNAKKGNTEPWREVPLQDSLLPLITTWYELDRGKGLPYIIHYNGKSLHSIKHSWKNTLLKAGITRHIRPYDLRHGFATEAIAAGADYGTVAALMGHKSPTMVLKHYQHVSNRQKKSAIENLPKIKLASSLV